MPVAEDTDQRRSHVSVFDLMDRMKMPVLWVCVVIMGGFGVWWLFGDLFNIGGPKVEVVEEGSFEVPGGKKVTLTNTEFGLEAQQINNNLASMFGRAEPNQIGNYLLRSTVRDEIELAWAWMILREAARSGGVVITDDVVIKGENKRSGKEMTRRDYERKVPEGLREVQRDANAIGRFRMLLDKAQPEATWDKLFEKYQSTYEDLRASFVFFDTSKAEVKLDAKQKLEDRVALDKWLQDNPAVRSTKKIPEELDAKVLYVRFKDEPTAALKKQFDERWAPLIADLKIAEPAEEALKVRYELYRPAYEVPLKVALDQYEKDAASRATDPASRPIDRPNEFQLLKDRLRIEYFATRLLEKAFEEVTRAENPLSFEDAQSKYGLKLAEVTHMDSLRIQQHPDFGTPRGAPAMLQELREKSLKPGEIYKYQGDPSLSKGAIEEPGSNVAIWRLTKHYAEREATLDDPGTIEFFTDEYVKKRRQELAKEQAEDFRKAVDQKVSEALATKVAELEATMKAEVDKQIADQHLDREKAEDKPKILEIENAAKAKKDTALDAEKANVEPNIFQAVAAERFLTPRDTGWIAKTSNRNASFQANDKLTVSEKAEQFFRKAARRLALAALKPGRMGQVETEPNWDAAAVPLLVSKRVPVPEDLYKLSRSQIESLKQQVSPQTQSLTYWTYENFKKPEWFNLNVPSLDKSIEAKREADKASAEKRRVQDEAKKRKSRARAEKATQDTMQTRPLFSGEDW